MLWRRRRRSQHGIPGIFLVSTTARRIDPPSDQARQVPDCRLNWSNLYTRLQTLDSARVKRTRASRLMVGVVRDAVFFADVVNGADVRVVQSRSSLGFTAKSLQSLAVLG